MQRLTFVFAVMTLGSVLARGDEPARKYQVVSPKNVGIIATGINGGGEIIGFEWVEEKEQPGVISQVPFVAKGKEMTLLPLLRGYTATFPAAISDTGIVVGRVGKPATPGAVTFLRNQAFVWDAKRGIRGLGALRDDTASLACAVSRDGRRIAGYSVGDNRIRVCVWDQDGDGWRGTAMPHLDRLGSTVVSMSGDGNFVAAPDGAIPCLWSRDASGSWKREAMGEAGSFMPRAVNDSGTVAGVRYGSDGETHAMIFTRGDAPRPIAEPAGYVRSQANALNNLGVVIGMIDGPRGSEVGPNAFVYEQGRLRILDEAGPFFTDATAINDQGQVAGVFEMKDEDAPVPPAQKPDAPPAEKPNR